MGTVYLICLDEKLSHAKHYIGYTKFNDIRKRLREHKSSNGAAMLKACNKLGVTYNVTRTWEDVDRSFERRLKNRKKSASLCPICRFNKNKGIRDEINTTTKGCN